MIKKRILIFLAFAFGIPWISALVISQSSMMVINPTQAGVIANYCFIFTPWLANIATRLITKEGWGNLYLRPKFKHGWRFYLSAWFLPLLAALVGGGVFYLLYPHAFDPTLGVVRKMVENTPSAALNPWVILISMTFSMIFISSLINAVASFGEEFGWRAYLFPKLMESFSGEHPTQAISTSDLVNRTGFTPAGARKAAVLTGLIHGIWHFPLLLLTASIVPNVTILMGVVYILLTCSISVLLSWATLRSGSVWPASLGHGAGNATSALPGFLLKGSAIPLVGPDPTGLIGGLGYTILALVLLLSRNAFAGSKETGPK